jgi:hypothetical protein
LTRQQVAAVEATAAAADDGSAASKGWQPSNMQATCDTFEHVSSLQDTLPKVVLKKLLALDVRTFAAGRGHLSDLPNLKPNPAA